MNSVFIKGLVIEGCCGCEPSEKIIPQKFIFDVEVYTSFRKVRRTDQLEDAFDYRVVDEIIEKILRENIYSTIERLGFHVLESLFQFSETIDRIVFTISKPEAPVDFYCDTVGVSFDVERSMFV